MFRRRHVHSTSRSRRCVFFPRGKKRGGTKQLERHFQNKSRSRARTKTHALEKRERKRRHRIARGWVGRSTFAVVRVHRFIFRATRKEIVALCVFRRRKHVRQLRRGGGGVRGVVVADGPEFRGHDGAGGVRDVREGHSVLFFCCFCWRFCWGPSKGKRCG